MLEQFSPGYRQRVMALVLALGLCGGGVACAPAASDDAEALATSEDQPSEPEPVFDRDEALRRAEMALEAVKDARRDARDLAMEGSQPGIRSSLLEEDWSAPQERTLAAAQALLSPEPWEIDPRVEEMRSGEGDAEAVATRSATGDRPLTYRVRSGDSLSVIASRTMGSSGHWRRLYEFNRDTIGPSPERLREGMELRIPQD